MSGPATINVTRAEIDRLLASGRAARTAGERAAALAAFNAAAALEPGHVWAQIEIATELREVGRLDEAVAAFHAVLVTAPSQLQAHLGLGACARKRGDREAALACYRAAQAAAPESVWPLIEGAAELLALGRGAEAEAAYRAVLVLAPGQIQAQLGLGGCARSRGDHEEALACYVAAAAAAPGNVWPQLESATEFRALGRFEQAEAAYRAVLVLSPGQLQAHLGLGACARVGGHRQRALDCYGQAAAAAPGSVWPLLESAVELRELGRSEEAEAAYRAVLAMEPGQLQAHLALGACARGRGDREAALTCYRAAQAAVPASVWPLVEAATELRELGRFEAAETACRAALVLAPGQVQAHLGLGLMARKRADSAAAIGHFERALLFNPDSVAACIELAAEHRDRGALGTACRFAARALEREPANLHALLGLGLIERYAGLHAEALASFEEAHRWHPDRVQPILEMAMQQRSLGRQDLCDALVAGAIDLEPASIGPLMRLAERAMAAQDPQGALGFYGRAAARRPDLIEPRLGAVEALATLGRFAEAFADLDVLEGERSGLSAIMIKRIGLQRRTGRWILALGLARKAAEALPWEFPIWTERLTLELLVGEDAAIDECLARAPARTEREHARLARLAGAVHEARQGFGRAADSYRTAEALDPTNAEIQHDLTRAALWVLDLDAARAHLRRFCQAGEATMRLRGRSLNMSQTHLGQIIDEYALDGTVADALSASATLPARNRLVPIRRLVADNPDSTAAAISLMLALREAGLLDVPGGRTGAAPHAIPRRIVQFWDTRPIPADVVDIMQSWRAGNPSHAFEVFDDGSARAFLGAHDEEAQRAYDRVREPAQRADLFRLAYLAIRGGIYIDADDRCLAPLAAHMPAARLVLYQEDIGSVGNNFIAAVPGHPVLIRARDLAVTAIGRGDTDVVWLSTGPGLLTRALAHWLAQAGTELDDVAVLSRRGLFRFTAVHCMTGYKSTDRHWSNTAFGRNRRPAMTVAEPSRSPLRG